MFRREELQDIRDTALELSHTEVVDSWRIVLQQLANAADHLDAMIARTAVKEVN